MTKDLVSIVIPIYNEELIIDQLFNRTIKAFSLFDNFEIICVNDGSKDKSLEKMLAYHQEDERFKVVDLSKNCGHQKAVFAGLSVAKGEYIGVMDGDLQDPPELFADFLTKAKEGFEVVYAVRKKRKEGIVKKSAYWIFYRLFQKMSSINIPLDSGDFCLMHRVVLDQILAMPEQALYIRGLRAFAGFNQYGFEYERNERFAGDAKYGFSELFSLASNGIFSFSKIPIKFMRIMGYGAISISLIYSLKVLFNYVVNDNAPEGFVSLILAIIFFSGVQLLSLGILGEYISRIYDETRKRPLYIIRKYWDKN